TAVSKCSSTGPHSRSKTSPANDRAAGFCAWFSTNTGPAASVFGLPGAIEIRLFSIRAPGVRTRRQPGWRFSLRQMLVAVPLLGLLCWPLAFVAQRSVEDRKHARCAANLAALGVAMDQYHQKYGHFPPAFVPDAEGRPAHSWR